MLIMVAGESIGYKKMTMTDEEFKRSWIRESVNQPGLMLDVQDMPSMRFVQDNALLASLEKKDSEKTA